MSILLRRAIIEKGLVFQNYFSKRLAKGSEKLVNPALIFFGFNYCIC